MCFICKSWWFQVLIIFSPPRCFRYFSSKRAEFSSIDHFQKISTEVQRQEKDFSPALQQVVIVSETFTDLNHYSGRILLADLLRLAILLWMWLILRWCPGQKGTGPDVVTKSGLRKAMCAMVNGDIMGDKYSVHIYIYTHSIYILYIVYIYLHYKQAKSKVRLFSHEMGWSPVHESHFSESKKLMQAIRKPFSNLTMSQHHEIWGVSMGIL